MAILAMNITGRMPVPRLVGAGLALPLFCSTGKLQGQGKPSRYKTHEMVVEKTRIYGIALQTSAFEVCGSCRDTHSQV
jgi:hypothetical protein